MKRLLLHLSFIGVTLSPLAARVGESLDECDKRYGKATFQHDNEDWSFRTYRFEGKTIKVFLYQKRSFYERLILDPVQIRSKSDVATAADESLTFFKAFLTAAYQFSDEQLQTAAKIRQTKPNVAEGAAETATIRAEYLINSDEAQRSITFTVNVVDKIEFPKQLQKPEIDKSFKAFLADSLKREQQAVDTKKAGGL